MNRLAIVADSPPWDLSGKWRLDCGANKTAYERPASCTIGPIGTHCSGSGRGTGSDLAAFV